MTPDPTPRNVVDNPVLNSPFEEPKRYWDFSAARPRIASGRRPAGYYGKLPEGALATQEMKTLVRVNDLRERVRAWRERGYEGVTRVTRDLLDHWSRADRRPLFFCQREAVETIIWLTEASAADRQGADVPQDEPGPNERAESGFGPLTRWCTKMATGSGKTIVMAMVAAWSILNKAANKQDARFSENVLVIGPNLTVRERLAVLSPKVEGNYYVAFDLVPPGYRDLLARGRVGIVNWHQFLLRDDGDRRGVVQRGRESDAALVKRVLGEAGLGGATQILVLNDEAHHAYRRKAGLAEDEQAKLFEEMSADEREETEEREAEATVWVGGLDRIQKERGIRMLVDVSATPFYLKGSGYEEGEPLPWIVSDFGLVDAIESGITKVPRIPVADDSGRPDPKYFRLWKQIMDRLPAAERESNRRRAKPESVAREAHGALSTLAAKWKATAEHFERSGFAVPPALIVVAANTKLAEIVATTLRRGEILDRLGGDYTFSIDSKVLAAAEADGEGTKDDAKELLRLKTATIGKATWPGAEPPEGYEHLAEPPGKDVRCVVSVGMLTEGWDAPNVTQILGLRAFGSQLLCEQVVGRGLRRMSYDVDPATGLLQPEYCDVFGVPFEVVPVQGTGEGPIVPPPPSTLVQALPERKELQIEFPRVEGYVRDVKQRIRCDVDALAPLFLEPQTEPTQVEVSARVGGGNLDVRELLDRRGYHTEHRVQRTVFEIARDITEVLAGGTASEGTPEVKAKRIEGARILFPQVLAVVRDYVERRVKTTSEVPVEEIALARYRTIIFERLVTAIEPDTAAGEEAIRPRIERSRPNGSTAEVQFRTTKPTKPTVKSHVSHVTLDSPTWEGTATWHLERCPRVLAYARNERLGFTIPYQHLGREPTYEPDFLARVDLGDGETATLIVEIKGYEREQDRSKADAAARWVRAVNQHGGLGVWGYVLCKDPNELAAAINAWKPA
jgi:type III restriction enzyme